MTGNHGSTPRTRYLLDESLSRQIAFILAERGVPMRTVRDVFGSVATPDPDILDWCGVNDAVWIHSDAQAYQAHRERMLRSGARTLWLQRPEGVMTPQEQTRVIGLALPRLEQLLGELPAIRHYRVTAESPLHTPRLVAVRV